MGSFVGLLILGYLSCAEARGDTVEEVSLKKIPQQLVKRAAASTISQQTCQPDIYAVLRDMTALMTEQKIQLQATMDRLKDSESLIKALQVDLQQSQKDLQQSQKELRRLTDSDSRIKGSLATIEARSNATEHQVQFLQKQDAVKQVAFSYGLLASGNKDIGSYNVDTILTYRHPIINVGNAYNPDTGIFTAPVKGVYHFTIFIFGNGGKHDSAAHLYKNGKRVMMAYAYQVHRVVNSSNGASLLLEAGNVVYVKLRAKAWIYDNYNHHCTFSGHLLFTV